LFSKAPPQFLVHRAIPGKTVLILRKNVVVPLAIPHPFDDLDAIINPLQNAGLSRGVALAMMLCA